MNAEHILALLKFGNKDNLSDLLENGTIHMNSIQYFRNIEDSNLRGDAYEGVTQIINSWPGHFDINGVPINYLSVHVPQSYNTVYGNIYSLYCISSHGFASPKDFNIDKRVQEFGSHLLIISPGEFLKKIKNVLDFIGLIHHNGFVDYYDRNAINSKISLFQKPNEYEYQKEFRIYVERKAITPLVFKIGSIKEFAELHPVEAIDKIELKKRFLFSA